MRPPRGDRRPPWGRRGPPWRRPAQWAAFRGIHRSVVLFLLVAVLIGFAGGAVLHAVHGRGPGGMLCVLAALFAILWPLGWVATARIARPLRDLADYASEMRGGKLDHRDRLPGGSEEVGEVAGALKQLADRLGKQLQDQRALLAAVSHELRSPLGRARVLVEMSREGTAPPSVHDDLQAEIDAMDGLVGDLLAAARIDFEAITPRNLDARDLALRALEIARVPATALRVNEDARVNADPTLLARALSGLLDNARRYGGADITLRVRPEDESVRFEVDDDGPGFAPGDEERAFEPFWRGPAADGRAPARGEGLGLALVRQIAEAHGGRAGAEARPQGGARVWLTLPRAET